MEAEADRFNFVGAVAAPHLDTESPECRVTLGAEFLQSSATTPWASARLLPSLETPPQEVS